MALESNAALTNAASYNCTLKLWELEITTVQSKFAVSTAARILAAN
jgi:hypothetical protein